MKPAKHMALVAMSALLSACSVGADPSDTSTQSQSLAEPNSSPLRTTSAYEDGLAALTAKDYERARDEFLIANAEFPDAAAPINGMAIAEAGLGELDVAQELFQRALILEPGNETAQSGLLRVTQELASVEKSPKQLFAVAPDQPAPAEIQHNATSQLQPVALNRAMVSRPGSSAFISDRPLPAAQVEPAASRAPAHTADRAVKASSTAQRQPTALFQNQAVMASNTSLQRPQTNPPQAHRSAAGATGTMEPKLDDAGPLRNGDLVLLNGNGEIGHAGSVANALRARGVALAQSGTADRLDYARTIISYPPASLDDALRLEASLGVDAELKERDDGSNQIEVILGMDSVGPIKLR